GEFGKACGETCSAQDAHGVFGKSVTHMAQGFALDIGLAVVGVDQFAGFRPCNGIDSKVTTCKVFFQRDFGRSMYLKALVTLACLALGASECILFLRFWVEKYRKILAYRAIALFDHLLGRSADYD